MPGQYFSTAQWFPPIFLPGVLTSCRESGQRINSFRLKPTLKYDSGKGLSLRDKQNLTYFSRLDTLYPLLQERWGPLINMPSFINNWERCCLHAASLCFFCLYCMAWTLGSIASDFQADSECWAWQKVPMAPGSVLCDMGELLNLKAVSILQSTFWLGKQTFNKGSHPYVNVRGCGENSVV